MKIIVAGQAYEHISRDVNYQRCVNLYVSASDILQGAEPVLLPTPGCKSLISGLDPVRGLFVYNDTLYAVAGRTFYEVTIDEVLETGSTTSRGTLTSNGTNLVSMARNPTQIMITDGTADADIFTVSTNALAELSDADFTGASNVVFMDSYFVYSTPDAATMFTTAVNNGASVSALDVATAEAYPDRTLALAVDKRELWVFGERSTEIWYDAANTSGFPFSRREGALIDLGCSAGRSVQNIDNGLIWLDSRRKVVRNDAYTPVPVSTPAIEAQFEKYLVVSDAYAHVYTEAGSEFYCLTFPTAKKTWCYDVAMKAWHERAYFDSGNNELVQSRITCCVRFKNMNIVGTSDGRIGIQRITTYDDFGAQIHRIRTTTNVNTEQTLVGVDTLDLHMEVGKGTVTGTGSDPQVSLRYSNDGGYTWSHHMNRSMGKLGEYGARVRWNRLGTAREWVVEFRIVEPVKFAIMGVSVNGGAS